MFFLQLLTYTLANYNDGAVLFDFHLVGLPIFASADSIVGNVSTNTTVPAPMNGPALFSSGDTTDTFVNITYEPCSAKVASWVSGFLHACMDICSPSACLLYLFAALFI